MLTARGTFALKIRRRNGVLMQGSAAGLIGLAVVVGVGVPFAALWSWALVDVFQRPDWEFPARRPGSNDHVSWTFVVVVLSGLGSLCYYLMVMKPYPRQRR